MADFLAIYHMLSYDHMDGPQFLLYAARLPLYSGCVRKRMEIQQQEETDDGSEPSDYDKGQSMSLQEAVSRSTGNSQGTLDQLNREGIDSGFGDLFEHVVV